MLGVTSGRCDWLAGCWPLQGTSHWLVGVFTSRDWNWNINLTWQLCGV